MSGTCSIHGTDEKCMQNLSESMMVRDHSEAGWEAVDWSHLTQDRDQWQALVNIIMNL
jgi:hypothetical protein